MNKRTIYLTLTAALALAVFIYACSAKAGKTETAADVTQTPVKLATVHSIVTTDPIVASGFIQSETEARLSFKTGGVIQRIYVEEGESVQKDQLLATLNLTEINAMVEQARQGLEKAQRDYDRANNLYRDTVASLEQLQNATTGLNVAKQQYEMAKFNRNYSEIRATAAGKIVKKLMNEGEIVSPGLPIFYMTSAGANDWVVKVGISDKDWARLQIGNSASITIDAYTGESFSGVVSKLSQVPDPMSGLYQAEIKLKPTGKNMATGLFAKAEITPSASGQYVAVPIDAIIEGNGKDAFVFTVDNGMAHKVPVKIAFIKDKEVMLSGGLDATAQVITDGSAYLTDGVAVQVSAATTETAGK